MENYNHKYFEFINSVNSNEVDQENIIWLHGIGNEGKSTLIKATDLVLPGQFYYLSADIFNANSPLSYKY